MKHVGGVSQRIEWYFLSPVDAAIRLTDIRFIRLWVSKSPGPIRTCPNKEKKFKNQIYWYLTN